jgi:hypothetical protein
MSLMQMESPMEGLIENLRKQKEHLQQGGGADRLAKQKEQGKLPLGLVRSAGNSNWRSTASAWAANASLTSNRSTSLSFTPVFLARACTAGTGQPVPEH